MRVKNFRVQWDRRNGTRVTSVVSYSGSAAENRKAALEAEGMSNVAVVAAPIFTKHSG